MSHDFNYRIDGTALVSGSGPCRFVVMEEGAAGKRADMVDIAYRHGVYVAPRHWTTARLFNFKTGLFGGNAATIFASKTSLLNLMHPGLRTLTRADPDIGADVETQIFVGDDVTQGGIEDRFEWEWSVWQTRGYWEEATASHDEDDLSLGATGSITTINVGGSHPTEPVFTITCDTAGTNPAIEDPATGDMLILADSFDAADEILVDVPDRKAYLNGTRVKNMVTINRGHWMEFAAGATVDLDFTSDSGAWDVNTVVANRWRG